MSPRRNKGAVLKRVCCHGCQALRASTAVLGIELGGHRTYSCCVFVYNTAAAFNQKNEEESSMVRGEGTITGMHTQPCNLRVRGAQR